MQMLKKFISACLAILLITFTSMTAHINVQATNVNQKYNVLIIHSYHKGFTWTDQLNDGLVNEMKKSNLDIEYYIEYLDWKRYPNQSNLDNMFKEIKTKYSNIKINLIATSDDAALKFALKYRKDALSNAPVVFSGVNKESAFELIKNDTGVTGILENIDPENTIKIAMQLNKNLKKVYVVFDNTESGLSTGKITIDAIKKVEPTLEVVPLNDKTHEEIIQISRNAETDSAFLLTTYYTDKLGNNIDFEAFCKILNSNSVIPIYSLYEFHMNSGAVGGSMTSGKLIGVYQARLGIRILNGENIASLHIEDRKTERNIFDYEQLKKYNMDLSLVPENSTIINKPFSFFETYKSLVIGTISAFIVLIMFILILVFYINRIKKIKAELEASEERYKLVAEAANDGLWDWNVEENTYLFSDRWYELFGYNKYTFEGNVGFWEKLVHPDDLEIMHKAKENYFQVKNHHYECEFRMKANDGRYKWIHSRGKALFNEKGQPYWMSGAHVDISKIKEYQEILEYSAQHDALTGLYNRRFLNEEIENHISAIKNENFIEAMLFIDMDNFKLINDTMGHSTGDKLLCIIGEKLSKYKTDNIMLFRLGGDEFIFYLKQQINKEAIETFARKIQKSVSEPISLMGGIINPTVSIGIALYPEDGENVGNMLRCADIAMYKAKKAGKNVYHFYNDVMNKELLERVNIENQMRVGLKKGEFELYYQPMVNTSTQGIERFEALIRWSNSELGKVPPMKFIPIAEETGFIIPLGDWIIENACRFIKEFNLRNNSKKIINVNISVIQIMKEDFLEKLFKIVDDVGVQSQFLELEITESVIMESPELIIEKIELLKSYGICIAMDDFGTGYSSLASLKKMPISTLKIDKSFIDNIKTREQKNTLTEIIIEIGHKMSLVTVAEGVEDVEQYEFLKLHGCDLIQGYYFYKPMSAEELEKRVESRE
jgi:diguanylate cyclase (GGDEF)-like protein/PAS domain S-box-containing protein